MVGVAGKSKACHECRIRRVKCDLERPRCRRCAKAQLQCSGYKQKTIFINRTSKDPLTSAATVLARHRQASVQLLKCTFGQPHPTLPYTTSPRFRLAAFELLQKIYLPQLRFADGNTNTAPFDWVRAVCELQEPCFLLDHSLLAFCTAQLYVTGAADVSYEECSDKYHAALRLISSVSSWDGDTRVDYILASIVVLSTCEMFISPTDDGWRLHVQGVASMLSLRKGASTMPQSTWISLCSRLRLVSTISYLTTGEQGPMSSIEWQAPMSGLHNDDPFDQLIDLAAGLPQIFGLVAKGLKSVEGTLVTDILKDMLRRFSTDYESLRAGSSEPLYTAVTSRSTNPSDEPYGSKLYPIVLHFRSLQITGYSAISWALQLHIHILLIRQASEEKALDTSVSRLMSEANRLARCLCQSVEYCHRIEMGAVGPQAMSYAKWVMQRYFERFGTQRELDWFQNISNMKGDGMRFSIKLMTFDASHCGKDSVVYRTRAQVQAD